MLGFFSLAHLDGAMRSRGASPLETSLIMLEAKQQYIEESAPLWRGCTQPRKPRIC